MKHLLFIFFAIALATPLFAQQSVIIKEPAGQCYEDLKTALPSPQAIRWNDEQMSVTTLPLIATMEGELDWVVRIFPEPAVNKKTKEKVEVCKLVVGFVSPEHATAWNAGYSGQLHQEASVLKARIESAMKEREKKAREQQ